MLVAAQGAGPPAAAEAAKLAGVEKVLLADDALVRARARRADGGADRRPGGGYDAIVAPATTTARTSCRAWCALLDVMQVSEIIAVVAPDTFERPIYAGNAIQTVKSKDAKKVITVRTSPSKAKGDGGTASVEKIAAAADPGVSSFVGGAGQVRPSGTGFPQDHRLRAAAAMQSAENFQKYIEPVADASGAVGASRGGRRGFRAERLAGRTDR